MALHDLPGSSKPSRESCHVSEGVPAILRSKCLIAVHSSDWTDIYNADSLLE